MKSLIGGLVLVLLLWIMPAWAQALLGPVVGPFGCTASWSPPTNSDGTPYTATVLNYKLYIAQALTPMPVPGVTSPAMVITGPVGTSAPTTTLCTGTPSMIAGQNYAWITATDAKGETGLSAVFPFVWSLTVPVITFTNPPGALKFGP